MSETIMKRYIYFFILIIITLFSISVPTIAQNTNQNNTEDNKTKKMILEKRLKKLPQSSILPDSLSIPDSAFYQKIAIPRDSNGLIIMPRNQWVPFDESMTFIDTVIIDPSFLPVAFEGKLLDIDSLDFLKKEDKSGIETYRLISPDSSFENRLEDVKKVEKARKMYYTQNPRRIKANALAFDNTPVIAEEVVNTKNPWKELISTEKAIDIATPEIDKIGFKQIFWKKNGAHKLQLSQNYYSDNWGSDKNFNIYSEQTFNFKYEKNKIRFENKTEWKLNLMQTIPSDDSDNIKHKTRFTTDLFRTYSTFGINAYKNWSYSTNLEISTPFFNRYVNQESDVRNQAIFSPLKLNAGIGLRYAIDQTSKTNKHRTFKFSTDISLFSFDLKFVGDKGIDETLFGIDEGNSSKEAYGSALNFNLKYSHNRYTTFDSRLKCFYDYIEKDALVEFENSFDFKLNNYFSTTLYLYLIYDNSVSSDKKDSKLGYWKLHERVMFGLSYNW